MRRGDIVIAAPPGDYGKPRPVLILQSDSFALPSLTIAPLTSDLKNAPLLRIPIEPDKSNGLQKPSQIMIDKIVTVPRSKIGQTVGKVDHSTLQAVRLALLAFLELDEGAL